ncbi:DUF4339 domain-containing protein [Pseudomonas sp. P9_31]|uniref:DUF4339 domain-containing protein n=1 Tax=Pseudomonas sp. P9_31 TaxID=3043448 RepID=UPI002A364F97|nr:DUF4339 domain-containing protein [Pseudomonas sp. P9_31]WPN56674.1 DUF4339 domain-containing protein [Pseudomonas sp. P9_31]
MNQVQWFYDDSGSRVGPVTESEIKGLLKVSKIGHGTLVWRTGMTDWIRVESSELITELATTPPPLSRDRVSDLWVWLLALSPVIWLAIDASVLNAGIVVSWLITIALCALDINKLRSAGYQAPAIWWSFVVPGYLYLRSKNLKSSYAPLIVWVLINVALVVMSR